MYGGLSNPSPNAMMSGRAAIWRRIIKPQPAFKMPTAGLADIFVDWHLDRGSHRPPRPAASEVCVNLLAGFDLDLTRLDLFRLGDDQRQ